MFRRSKKEENTARQPVKRTAQRKTADVFSYHAYREVREERPERQPELMQAREHVAGTPARRRARAVVLLVILLVAAVFVTWLGNNPRIVVLGSASDKALLQNTSVYQRAAVQALSASLANHNKLTIDTAAVTTKLERSFPELQSVSIQLPLIGTEPRIYVQPAVPVLRLVNDSGAVYVLAASGKVLAPVGQISQLTALSLPLVADQSGLNIQTGQPALPSTNVTFIEAVIQQLKAQHFTVTSLTLPRGTSELDVRLGGKPFFVKFNLENDVNQQLGTFLATNKYLLQQNITPAQYIDVRVPGRSYYK